MRYEEPELRILLMNVENVICESPWIEEGDPVEGGNASQFPIISSP